jgi:hypothetical protein
MSLLKMAKFMPLEAMIFIFILVRVSYFKTARTTYWYIFLPFFKMPA